MDEIDLVLLLEETGRAAMPETVISTAAVGVPLLREAGGAALCERWLPAVARGEAVLAVSDPTSPFVSDAHIADLLLLFDGEELHAVPRERVQLTAQPTNDPSQRLFSVSWTSEPGSRLEGGRNASDRIGRAFDRGALATAAQQLGVTQKLIDLAVAYALERRQFGAPIGSFQAIKHMLADLQVKLEYARPGVYRAAHSLARGVPTASSDVSMARVAAGEAAWAATRTALQVHGAIGYTWEQDLHIWMRRAWSLDGLWGSGAEHRRRLSEALLDDAAPIECFGYSAPGSGPD